MIDPYHIHDIYIIVISNTRFMKQPLTPMTPEKHKILQELCKEWNSLIYDAQKIRRDFFKKKEGTKNLWKLWSIRLHYLRDKRVKGRKGLMSYRARRQAWVQGAYGVFKYTPKTGFFIDRKFYRQVDGYLWIMLTPGLELGFEMNRQVDGHLCIRKDKHGWHLELPDLPP
jgi:hypothetical protein